MAKRIDVKTAHDHIAAGNALLVCAYDDEKCRQNHLDGSITLSEFRARADSIPKDKEIAFYCA